MRTRFEKRLLSLQLSHKELLHRANKKLDSDNGIFNRYSYPVLTANHTPISWRYDLNYETNPYLMERFGVNAVLNAGAIKLNDKYLLVAILEGADGKSFLAIAESNNGIDSFEFWDYPVIIPETDESDLSICDMRIMQHEDGWIYAIFYTERQYPQIDPGDQSKAVKQCGMARTSDLKTWERLPDLKTRPSQPQPIVLHSEFVNGKYTFYTGLQEVVIAGKGGGFGLVSTDSVSNMSFDVDIMPDQTSYNKEYELKNGLGPAPIKTQYGWLHLAHTVRRTRSGLRNVLYLFMTDLRDLTNVIYKPCGYFLAAGGNETTGDGSDIVFSNGWIAAEDGTVHIYFVTSDTRLHVATSTIDQLLDYVMNTAPDGLTAARPVSALYRILDNNKALMQLNNPRKKL